MAGNGDREVTIYFENKENKPSEPVIGFRYFLS